MGIRTRNSSQAEARKRFRRDQEAWQAGQPRRCETNIVGGIGECLACDAEQGEHCKSDHISAPNPDQARKAAKAKHDAPITKIKRVKEDA